MLKITNKRRVKTIRTTAQKEASKRYKQKTIQKLIQYYPKELEDWNCIENYLTKNNLSYQQYVKELVISDLKSKGYIKEDNNERDESGTTI